MSAYLEAENNNSDLIKPWLMALFESLPKEEERYTRSPARITYSLKRLVKIGEAPRFLQLYIYDTNNEVTYRLRHFEWIDNRNLDLGIIDGLIHFIDTHKELVDPVSKIQSAKDVDQFISAKLPDPSVDPDGYKVVSEMMMHGPCGHANLTLHVWKMEHVDKIIFKHISKGTDIIFARVIRPTGEPSTKAGPSRPSRAACEALSLLGDDKEWDIAIQEACAFATPAELRSFLAHIILHCDITNLSKLWTKYWKEMSRDMPEKVSQTVQIPDYRLNDDGLQGYTLYEIEVILNNHGKSLQNFGLPPPLEGLLAQLANRLLIEERIYNQIALMQEKSESVSKLNDQQKIIYSFIINSNARNLQELIFVYGYGENVNSFASWLLDVGDGIAGRPDEEDPENTSWIDIPPTYCVPPDNQGLSKLIDFIYDQSTLQTPSAITLQQKEIVCPKNKTANIINLKVLDMVNGECTIYVRQDEAVSVKNDKAESEMLYPVEHLNTLKLLRFPPHQLELKVKAPVMLLRNVNLIGGLCNGTRMIVRQLMTKLNEV
nr:DNA helicase [Tanacetum cinerariifolium]